MPRELNRATLDQAAQDYAAHFLLPSRFSRRSPEVATGGREWALQALFKAEYKDEFEALLPVFKDCLGKRPLAEFEALANTRFTPREDSVLVDALARDLAITPDGAHIEGRIGRTVVGHRLVGRRVTRHGVKNAQWPIYAGEELERGAGRVRERGADGPGTDPLPPVETLWPGETSHMGVEELFALNTNVSIAWAQAALNAALDLLDEGTGAGVLKFYTTAQPVDPDAAVGAQTLLATLPMSATAFGNATDNSGEALGTAAAITDDSSADATDTAAWVRGSSSNDGAAALNDHIDGEAGTSGADFNMNTLAFVTGATISVSAWTVTQDQGPTAT